MVSVERNESKKRDENKEKKEKNHHQNPSRAKGKRFHWTKPPKQDYSPISCMKLINKDILKKPNMPKVNFVQQIIRERRASSAWRSTMMPRQGHPNWPWIISHLTLQEKQQIHGSILLLLHQGHPRDQHNAQLVRKIPKLMKKLQTVTFPVEISHWNLLGSHSCFLEEWKS